jgi:ribonuclease HI
VRLLIHIDGGARGNPGEAGFGVHVRDGSGAVLAEQYGYLGVRTNNVAEYAALIAALRYAAEAGAADVEIRSDSELLVRQMEGTYRVKNPGLIPLHRTARGLLGRIPKVRIVHVPRERNREADHLANLAMDSRSEEPAGVTSGLPLPPAHRG